MNFDVQQITDQALSLPDEARLTLVDRLVESLDPLDDAALRAAWAAEARRRLEEIRSGAITPIPGEEALSRVRARFGL